MAGRRGERTFGKDYPIVTGVTVEVGVQGRTVDLIHSCGRDGACLLVSEFSSKGGSEPEESV